MLARLREWWYSLVRGQIDEEIELSWLVYVVDGDEESDFFFSMLRGIVPAGQLNRCGSHNEVVTKNPAPFVYIGQGNPSCVFRSTGYSVGVKKIFCDGNEVQRFPHRPVIWWAGNSANWCKGSPHSRWLGLENMLGADLRTQLKKKWWEKAAKSLWTKALRVAEGLESVDSLKATADKLLGDVAKQHMQQPEANLWPSLLFMEAIASGLAWGDDFGQRADCTS